MNIRGMSLSVLLSVKAGVLGIDFHDLVWNIGGVSRGADGEIMVTFLVRSLSSLARLEEETS